jgi:MFS transporter, CP family, cyanate transporter
VKPKHIFQSKAFLTLSIIFVAFSLRTPLSYSPLVNQIRVDLGISNTEVGLLMTLPLLLFAFFSPISIKLGDLFGNELTIFIGLIILAIGEFIRPWGDATILFLGISPRRDRHIIRQRANT